MKFSVIIPTYNRAELLNRCLKSLENQTFKDFEVLVCDDGSTDNTKEITEHYITKLNIKYLWNENWGGPARPRNRGIEIAQGEWICFLDSDDWWTPNKLEYCLSYLVDNDIIFHSLQVFSEKEGLQNKFIRGRKPKKPLYVNLLKNGNCGGNSSVVIRHSIVEKIGLFTENKDLIAVEDFDYWLRVSQMTERFCFIPKVLGYYWIGNTSISLTEKQIQKHINLYQHHLLNIKDNKIRREIEACQSYRNARAYVYYKNYEEVHKQYKTALKTSHLYTKLKSLFFLLLNYKNL